MDQNNIQDQPNRQPNNSNPISLFGLFPVPSGDYHEKSISRVINNTVGGQNVSKTAVFDAYAAVRPFRTNAMEMTAMTSGSTDQFTVTFEIIPGKNVIATAYHKDGELMLARLKADMREILDWRKARQAGNEVDEEYDPVVSYNLIGLPRQALNPGEGPAINQLRNNASNNTNENRTSVRLVEFEAIRASGEVEKVFTIPNSRVVGSQQSEASQLSDMERFLQS